MLLARVLSRVLGEGQLTIIDAAGRSHRVEGPASGPAVTMRVHDLVDRRAAGCCGRASPSAKPTWTASSPSRTAAIIYDLLDLLGRNMAALESTPFVRWSYALAAA